MKINTNISSLTTQHYLSKTTNGLEKAMERLSSGSRINSASDDAAGLAISERMSNQIRGLDVASRNASDGISLLETAEGGLGSISDILQRMRELAVQADNGTYSTTDKAALQSEFAQLIEEVDHIASTNAFNNVNLLDGSSTTISLHISDLASDTMTITLTKSDADTLGVKNLDISTAAGTAMTALDTALNTVSTTRATLGSYVNRLNFTVDNINVTKTNASASRSRIQDADMAEEMSKLSKQSILSQTATAMLAKANQQPQLVLSLLNS